MLSTDGLQERATRLSPADLVEEYEEAIASHTRLTLLGGGEAAARRAFEKSMLRAEILDRLERAQPPF